MLPKIFTISILAIVSFMLFAGFTQNQKVAMYCFYAIGIICGLNFFSMIRDLIDKSSK
jgi:hypothetical protein